MMKAFKSLLLRTNTFLGAIRRGWQTGRCEGWRAGRREFAIAWCPVVAWGWNEYGQTKTPVGLDNVIKIAAGTTHSLALRSDGTVVAWGTDYAGDNAFVPDDLSGVVAIAAGHNHNLALRGDGTVVAWGSHLSLQKTWLTAGATEVPEFPLEVDELPAPDINADADPLKLPADLKNVRAIAAGAHHNLALRSDYSVVAWGRDNYGETKVPKGLSNVLAIAAGEYHNLAMTADGKLVAWGRNEHGQCDVPVGLSCVVEIAAGSHHSLALRSNGEVVAWGAGAFGRMSDYDRDQCAVPFSLNEVIGIAAGGYHSLALRSDGTIVAWGRDSFHGQSKVPSGLSDVTDIAAGGYHNLALRGDPSVRRVLTNLQRSLIQIEEANE